MAVLDASVVHPTPEVVPSIVLPDEGPDYEKIYPVLQIPWYDNCPTVLMNSEPVNIPPDF